MPIPRPPDFERYEYDNLLPTWQPPEPLNRPEGHVPQGPIPPPDTPSVLGAKRNIRGELQEPDGGKARRKEGQVSGCVLYRVEKSSVVAGKCTISADSAR